MFTPQRKGWTGWATPGPANQRSSVGAATGSEGLAAASAPLAKGKGASQRAAELEKELHEYQYSMGLLLIEKKEWAAKYDEISQALSQQEEILKREQAAHLNAIAEYERREESIRKALGVEKQCVADLEKALREMRSEIAEVKFTSEKKMIDAQSLEARLEEKSMEIEGKLHAADAKLAEASRKKSQADRELEEMEARERRFEKEKLYFETERKAREKQLKEQEDSLQDWETKLKESQNRLIDLQRSLNDQEERANEKDQMFRIKQEELEESKKTMESMKVTLKVKEDDINKRLHELVSREKDVGSRSLALEKKEKQLADREAKASARETAELQKLLEGHKAELESKKRAFELELERERKSFDEKMKQEMAELARREKDVKSWEDKISKREQALNSGKQKLEDWENDLDTKSKALKKWEESLKNDEKKVSEEKLQLESERKHVEKRKLELQSIKASIEAEKQKILEEEEKLKVTQEEREDCSKLTAQLKQEIDEYRMRSNSLSEETEDLRQQRRKLEKEWEELDEKRTHLEEESKKLCDERARFERWRDSEETRLKNRELEVDAKSRKESEDLQLKEEDLMNRVQHQRLQIEELLKRERADIQRNLQLRRHELDMEMEKKQAEKERELEEKANELNKKIDFVESKMKWAIDSNESKIQAIILEREQLQREREVLLEDRHQLETDKADIKKDIESLNMLSKSLAERREAYNRDKNRLVDLAEKYKVCKSCGVSVFDELDLLGLQDTADVQHPSLALENYRSRNTETSPQGKGLLANSSGPRSLLEKCSRLFKFSPRKKAEQSSEHRAENLISFGSRLDQEASEGEAEYEPTPIYEVANDSFDVQELPSDNVARDNGEYERYHGSGDDQIEFSIGVADNSVDILRTQSADGTNDMGMRLDANIPSVDQTDREESSVPPEGLPQPETSKQRRRRSNRSDKLTGVRRTRSVREVVEDAKEILGETSEEKNDGQEGPVAGQKRRFTHLSGVTTSEQDTEDTTTHSESVSLGGQRRKRRQKTGPATQAPGEKRYNFRRTTINAAAAAQTASEKKRGAKAASKQKITRSGDDAEQTSKAEEPVDQGKGTSNLLQKSTGFGVAGVHEYSQEIFQVEEGEARAPADSSDDEYGDVADGKAAGPDAGPSTPSDSGPGGEPDDEDEDDSERQNQSIGKKLWSFFTT